MSNLTNAEVDALIPRDVIAYEPGSDQKTDQEYKRIARKSAFLITINPNISYKILNTPEKRKMLARKLIRLSEDIQNQFIKKQLITPADPKTNCNVEKVKYKIEIGGKRAFIHSHLIVQFSDKCKIDLPAIRAFAKDGSQFGFKNRKVFITLKPFQAHSEEVIEKYVLKGSVEFHKPKQTATFNRIKKKSAEI